MAKKRTVQERTAILAEMRANGLTQAAVAKKHGVSAVTIWQWNRAAKRRARRGARLKGGQANGLDYVLRSEVRDRIRDLLPGIVREKVAACLTQLLSGRHREP